MTEEQYYQITDACDKLLQRPDVTLEMLAIPWLHVLNEHPFYLKHYEDIFENSNLSKKKRAQKAMSRARVVAFTYALLARNVLRSIAHSYENESNVDFRGLQAHVAANSSKVDVVIVSWLVNVNYLEEKEDFYFGNIQSLLAHYGLSSLLVLRNQSGQPASTLLKKARREGVCSRMLLPDVCSFSKELHFLSRCFKAYRRLRHIENNVSAVLDRLVIREASRQAISNEVVLNLRLYDQIVSLCRQMKPSVIMTLFEGQIWEKFVWHAARTCSSSVFCVGYQHTILRKHSHAIKRSLLPHKGYNPDFILTIGDVTRKFLKKSKDLRGARIVTFGTHRCIKMAKVADGPNFKLSFLVLPEGIESECIYLFEFAIECARRLPDIKFILRTHPVLPFEKLRLKLRSRSPQPINVEVSVNKSIEEDFSRAGTILYRGSSTVIYAVLAGLKPFYVSKSFEMDIDPLYELSEWREHVSSVDELISKYSTYKAYKDKNNFMQWQRAREYCNTYVQPQKEEVMHEIRNIVRESL